MAVHKVGIRDQCYFVSVNMSLFWIAKSRWRRKALQMTKQAMEQVVAGFVRWSVLMVDGKDPCVLIHGMG